MKTRSDTLNWPAWMWILVGFLAGCIVAALAENIAGATPAPDDEPVMAYIASSWDGAFYSGRYFGDEPFVEIGSQVKPDTVVGTIEGLRRFQQYALVRGTIVEILVGDSQMVYMGQPLFKVKLAPKPAPQ